MVSYRARKTSAWEKTMPDMILPFKKLGKAFLKYVIHQSSNNFLEMNLLSVLYPEALAAINVPRYINAYLMGRFSTVAKNSAKHSTNLYEIFNF